jgi:iron complex transport system substrate-binding protein
VGRLTAAAAACAVVLGATACGERSEPTGSSVAIYPVTVQGAGERAAVLRHVPRRIAALGTGPRRIVRALGAEGRLVKIDSTLSGPALVGALAHARPDLILATRTADALDLARARTRTRAAVYVAPDSSIADVERAIDEIGVLVDRPLDARRVVRGIESERRRVRARLAGKPTVSVFVDTGFFITVPERSLLGDLVRIAKGESIAGTSPGQGAFPIKDIVKANPDVYLATSDAGVTLADLRGHDGLRTIKAVRKRRVEIVPVGLVTRPGARIGTGLMAVAKALHPDAFR